MVRQRTECVAYAAGEIPTLCVALRVRLRALPSAQDDISPALRVQMRTEYEAYTAGVEPPPYGTIPSRPPEP